MPYRNESVEDIQLFCLSSFSSGSEASPVACIILWAYEMWNGDSQRGT
jgi:hypothetical protein